MPQVRPIAALCYAPCNPCATTGGSGAAAGADTVDVSDLIAPPYDVLDEGPKRQLLSRSANNIVAVDLPVTPPKTVGPDPVYAQAGQTYRQWLARGVLVRRPRPAVFVYEQTYRHAGQERRRCGLIANLRVQPFGASPDGRGGVWAHELTFQGGRDDRLKLMRACQAQLSPIFGLYSDPAGQVRELLDQATAGGPPTLAGRTENDHVRHRVWEVAEPSQVERLTQALSGLDVYVADGHHRYHTAVAYRDEVAKASGGLPDDHPANYCTFVLVAVEDPGMIVLPTHRVLGGMPAFSFSAFAEAARGVLKITPWPGTDLAALEKALPQAGGEHAIGLYNPAAPESPLAIATALEADPLARTHAGHAAAWRTLDVAIVQHLIVEQLCQPRFCPTGKEVRWRFPHTLEQLRADAQSPGFQLGLVLQPTPLSAVLQVSRAGELMPQKSTFFYPKLATGLVINPLA